MLSATVLIIILRVKKSLQIEFQMRPNRRKPTNIYANSEGPAQPAQMVCLIIVFFFHQYIQQYDTV